MEQESKSRRWQPTNGQALWAIGMVVSLVIMVLLVVRLDPGIWQSLSTVRGATIIGIAVTLTLLIALLAVGGASLGWTGFANKTLWNWLQLLGTLAIPIVVAVATGWFTSQQAETQRQVEEDRAAAEQRLQDEREQDVAYQTYVGQMGTLMLEKNLPGSKQDSEVRTLARARTLTVLERMDPSHRTSVLQFLMEARLVDVEQDKDSLVEEPPVELSEANLQGVVAEGGFLRGAFLQGANLSRADLSDAFMPGVDLSCVDPDITDEDPGKCANLSQADLSGVFITGANLGEANLSDANLTGADLAGAVLSGANLTDAFFSGAYLDGANLKGAKGVDEDMLWSLQNQAESIQGATMPDGRVLKGDANPDGPTFEEWLKSKGPGEDGENNGPS